MPALDLVGIEMSWTSERARRNCTRARKPLAPRGVAELAPQYLSDRRFRQRIAKLDMSRNLVGGELQPAVLDDGFLCKLHVLAHNHHLHRLTRFVVLHADHPALEHALMHCHDILDLVRKDFES